LKPPVDPERLRARFPALGDADLVAYAEVTRRILADSGRGGELLAELASLARRAREKEVQGQALDADERTALAYWRALEKMQA